MTETTPSHAQDPAEGADPDATTAGEAAARPHAQDPAEGSDDERDAAAGADPANRITD